jgi:hypothetical protein
MKFIVLTILWCVVLPLYTLNLNLPNSAAQNSANSLNLIYPTPASAMNNPAIMKEGIETSVTSLYGMQDLPYYNFHFVYNFSKLSLHLGESYLDNNLYTESRTNLSLAYKLHWITIAGSIQVLRNKIKDYHDASAYIFNAGLRWELSKFTTGIACQNLSQTNFLNLKLPVIILWESCYQFTSGSKVSLGMEKEVNSDFIFKIASSYCPFPNLELLAGYQFYPDRIGFGMIFKFRNFNLSYSVRTHLYLGLTHYISVGYEI